MSTIDLPTDVYQADLTRDATDAEIGATLRAVASVTGRPILVRFPAPSDDDLREAHYDRFIGDER